IARASVESSSRRTTAAPSSSATCTRRPIGSSSAPCELCTLTAAWPISTFTLSGICTGRLPIRDIFGLRSVDGAEQLAAHAGLAGLAVDHHALAGGQDRYAETTQHAGDLVAADVPAQAGPRHAPQLTDHGAPVLVTQKHRDLALFAVLVDDVILDVALALEDVDDRQLQLAGRNHRLLVPRLPRV